MSSSPGAYIYTGPWINWDRGAILGSTITLSQRDGGLLTAFLGIFITVAGAAWWRILSFLIHQYRATPGPRDTVHHQQQVILRNSSTPGGAAWQMTQVAWGWRKIADHPVLVNLPLIALAISNMLVFAVAGVFSSEVAKAAGNETLIMGPNCGYMVDDPSLPDSSPLRLAGWSAMEANDTLVANSYARDCYSDIPDDLRCNRFVKPKLSFTSKPNASCPFSDDICMEGPTAAFEVDSGLMDSHSDLGINSRESDRVQYRKVTSCSALNTQDHAHQVNATDAFGNPTRITRYDYGSLGGRQGTRNWTFQYNLGNRQGLNGYTLTPLMYRGEPESADSTWLPIPALRRDDADVTILFLAQNIVTYTAPVLDPWFHATFTVQPSHLNAENSTYPVQPSLDVGEDDTMYRANSVTNVLACADRHQFCSPARQTCTPLTSVSRLGAAADALDPSDVQRDTAQSLLDAARWASTYHSVHSRGAAALRAADSLRGADFTQVGLPPDQWTREAAAWFAVALARLQQRMLDRAAGPRYVHAGLRLAPAPRSVCARQKVRSTGSYVSFSVFGVAVILVLGSLVVVAGLGLDAAVGFGMRRLGWKDHKRLQWAVDEKLQLQRLAYEGAGQGRWRGGAEAVPVTVKNDALGLGLGVDGEHPTLRKDGYHAVRGGEGGLSKAGSASDGGLYVEVEMLVAEPKRA